MNQRNDNDPGFDEVLAKNLQRVDAPGDLLSRVVAATQAQQQPRGRVLAFPRPPVWMSGAIAAGLIVCSLLGGEHVHREREQAKATLEFETSLRITDDALEQTREQLQRAGVSLDLK